MTQEQIKNLVQQVLTSAGTMVALLGVAKPDIVGQWTAAIMAMVGPILVIAGLIYGQWTNTQTGLVKAVDTLAKDPTSPVVGVIVSSSTDGKELAAAIPGDTTVPAGTIQAAKIANNQ